MRQQLVSRQSYRRISQEQLSVFARNVAKRLKKNPLYSTLTNEATLLDTTQQQYASALALWRDGGRDARIAKDQLRDAILVQLGDLSGAVDLLANGNPGIVLNAGFDLRRTGSVSRAATSIQPPTIVRVASNGRIGEVSVYLTDEAPRSVRQHGVEYSTDGGQTYQNGHYNSRTRFTLRDLPREKDLKLRFRALGAGDLKSIWSEPVTVAVL